MNLELSEMDAKQHRTLACGLFNFTWTLLDKPDRTPEEDDAMIHAAHASSYHWLIAGGPTECGRSHWQCARAYATLGRAEPALWHARRYRAICDEHGLSDFDRACAHEVTARSLAVAGRADEARDELKQARDLCEQLDDKDERDLVLADCAAVERTI